MSLRVVSGEPTADGTEFRVIFESDSREELLDGEVLRHAIKIAADAGFGLNCAITNVGNPYPVDETGKPITFMPAQNTRMLFRRTVSCAPRI